jgi:hypothetical protein
MATMLAILDLISIVFLTNTWVDWSDFLVPQGSKFAFWGRRVWLPFSRFW